MSTLTLINELTASVTRHTTVSEAQAICNQMYAMSHDGMSKTDACDIHYGIKDICDAIEPNAAMKLLAAVSKLNMKAIK